MSEFKRSENQHSNENHPDKEGFEFKRLLDLFNLQPEEKEGLQIRIEKSKGRIIVFIHPYYPAEHSREAGMDFDPEKLPRMREGFKNLLSSQWEKSPPIFIFEEAEKVIDLESTIKESLAMDTIVVETIPDNSEPIKGWEELKSVFKDLGVKLIIVGGMNLSVSVEDCDFGLVGCVPEATFKLAEDFELKMSRFLYPHGEEIYKIYGGPTGPTKSNND
jgi:hypothetical protein